MEKAIIKFGDNKIEKQKFHQYKRPISKMSAYRKDFDETKYIFFDKR